MFLKTFFVETMAMLKTHNNLFLFYESPELNILTDNIKCILARKEVNDAVTFDYCHLVMKLIW